jgi:hypothetical protein
MGLEPTTFCMASARDVRNRSLEFARERRFPGLVASGANPTEPKRTPNLGILATRQREIGRSWNTTARIGSGGSVVFRPAPAAPLLARRHQPG